MNVKGINIDKELMVKVGKKAGQYGKLIVIEGVKAVVAKGVLNTLNTAFDEGLDGVKNLKFEDAIELNGKKKKLRKKKFKKNEEAEELIEEVREISEKTLENVEETLENKTN